MSFVTPSNGDVTQLVNVLINTRSRTDLYAIIIDALDHFIGRITWVRDQAEDEKMDGSFSLLDDPGLKAMKKKIEWLMRFIASTLLSFSH